MGLYIINNTFLIEECYFDFTSIFNENSNEESKEREINGQINDCLGDLMAGEDVAADMLADLCMGIESITNPTWLERKQYQLEQKIKKYEEKLKSDKTGTFAKIWTRVKKILCKDFGIYCKSYKQSCSIC